jgi:hypothetical protein
MSDVAIVAMTDVALMAAAAHEVEDIVTHGAPPPRDAQARRLSRAPARGSDALMFVWRRVIVLGWLGYTLSVGVDSIGRTNV